MADHSNTTVVRGIDYKATFPFVHLFRGFRLAIDPSKIALALAALLLLYVGGRLLDAVWLTKHQAVERFDYRPTGATRGELSQYERSPATFSADRQRILENNREFVKGELRNRGITTESFEPDRLIEGYEKDRDERIKKADDEYNAKDKTEETAKTRDNRVRAAYAEYAAAKARVDEAKGEGLFIHFLHYEVAQVDYVVWSAIDLNLPELLLGLKRFFITAPTWAIVHHPLFFLLFFAWFLLLWAIFGGAVSRVAAVQVARDEKISIRQALRFSTGKVLSYVFAPLIPILIIAAIGLILAILAMFVSLPYGFGGLWSIVVGALFFVALIAGLVMMLTAVGLIGGGHMMYPTISVEGSDSFDAVSRSFSYLYARPWQLAFYSFVALVYGAVTYLFVRVALYVLLQLVHSSIGLFQWGQAADGTPIVNAMWPQPSTFMKLSYTPNFDTLGPLQSTGAAFIAFWVYLTIAMLGAYAVSLYFSSSTVIYYLLRKDVDATEMDEVYVEPNDEEFVETPPATVMETTTTSTETTIVSPPPAQPQGQPVDTPVPPPPTEQNPPPPGSA